MFSTKHFRGLMTILTLWCCSLVSLAQVQNTYFNGMDHDHYSITNSLSATTNQVTAGTIVGPNGTHDFHFMEIDPLGGIIWEGTYDTQGEDRVFDITPVDGVGYLMVGLSTVNGQEEAMAVLIDFAGTILSERTYPDFELGMGSRFLHSSSVKADFVNGDGFIACGWLGGKSNNDAKRAWVVRLDPSLNVIWARSYDSSTSAVQDWDMASNVIEAEGKGFFISGSANHPNSPTQNALAGAIDYSNNELWTTSYLNANGAPHYAVTGGAAYDAQTEAVYQLGNFSNVHNLGVNVFDFSTGLRDAANSYVAGSLTGALNLQGFKIMESASSSANLVVAGFVRDHLMQIEDPETGNLTTVFATAPFLLEIPKQPASILAGGGNPVLWDQIYEVPSPGYNVATDIYDAFSAGQQPRIFHMEMATARNTNNGYALTAYRGMGVPFQLEYIETDLNGVNPCESVPADFTAANMPYFDHAVDSQQSSTQPVTIDSSPVTFPHQEETCNDNPNPCTIQPSILVEQESCDTFLFTSLINGALANPLLDCFELDFGDGNSVMGIENALHTYLADGTYTVCLKAWCCDDPATVVSTCIDVTVECCDDPVPGIVWECNDDEIVITATHNGLPADASEYCWIWEDGTAGGTYTIPLGDCDGFYGVCLQMFCCDEGPANQPTICIDFQADCCEPCEPLPVSDIDFNWGPTFSPECPDGCAIGFDCPIIDTDKYCLIWDFGDGNTYTDPNSCPIHCYQCSGIYDVCLTVYCCEDESLSTTVCKQVEVNCCNLPSDVDFAYTYLDECTVVTDIIFGELPCPDDFCYEWDMGDGTILTGPGVTHMYPASGPYTICLNVFCCNDPSIGYQICKDIQVFCPEPCILPEPDFPFDAVGDPAGVDCEVGFCIPAAVLPPGANPDDYCVTWTFGDGTVRDEIFAFCPLHVYECSGEYEVCAEIYCCDNPDVKVASCQTITVDCCNLPTDVDFAFTMLDECTVITDIIFGDIPCPNDFCYNWDMGDGTILAGAGVTHTYPGSGVYNICLNVFCCNDASVGYQICREVQVFCPEPCVLPEPNFPFDAVGDPVGIDCEVGFCIPAAVLPPGANPDDYCVTWTFGDGTVRDEIFAFCPIHTYECSGEYEVCAEIYCCDNPDVKVASCQTITVDCCNLPTDVDFAFTMLDECTVITDIIFGDIPCPNDFCYNWDMGDGTILAGAGVTHTYPGSGVYNICLNVFCCNDASVGYQICREVQVFCPEPCILPEPGFLFDMVTDPTGADCEVGFCILPSTLPAGANPDDYCVTWYFGDGTVRDEIFAFCPIHTYECSGEYEVCAEIYCCNDPDNRVSSCQTLVVDCCNLPADVDFAFTMLDACTVITDIIFGDIPCPNDFCYNWDMGDGTILAGAGVTHTYPGSGVYNICLNVFCCNDASIGYQICKEVQVFCPEPCVLPEPNFPIEVIDLTGNCNLGFCVLPNVLPAGANIDNYCTTWYFGDGTIENHPLNTCPEHTYACSGQYEVCVEIFCCDEPNVRVSSCTMVDVSCCNLPSNADFDWTFTGEDCTISLDAIFGIVECPNDYCYNWDMGDGTILPGASTTYTYALSGVYTVCLNVFCCDDVNEGYSICKEIEIQCDDPCPKPCELHPVFIIDELGNCTFGFNNFTVPGMYTTITSYSWDFGDGNSSTAANPTHSYADSGTYTVCLTVTGFSPEGTCEQTFCWELEADCFCPEDINKDGNVNISDLLLILGVLGQTCN